MGLTVTFLEAVITVVALYFAWTAFFSPLSALPGPFLARLTNLWRLIDVYQGASDRTQLHLHRKHGHYVRLGPNFVSIADPALVPIIYSSRDVLRKSEFYSASDTIRNGVRAPSSFSTRSEEYRDYMTRPIKSAYSMPRMLQFEKRVDSTLRYLATKLKSYGDKVCPMGDLLMHFAWDVMSEVSFSKRFGALDNKPDALRTIADTSRSMGYFAIVGQMPALDGWFKNPIVPLGPQGFKYARDFAAAALGERIKTRDYSEQRDFTDLFIDAENDQDEGGTGEQFTQRQMAWLGSNVSAGSDTVASALQAAVFYVARDSEVKSKLTAELDEALGKHEPANWKACQNLPYLSAVIKETFRIAPSIGLPLERVVSQGGLQLGNSGVVLPAGTVVGVSPRVINHDKGTFGLDADEFNPGRWLRGSSESEADYQKRINRMRVADLTFGAGRRSCIGKNIAILEMYKCVASIFREFDITLAEPDQKLKCHNGWITKQHGLDMVVRPRR